MCGSIWNRLACGLLALGLALSVAAQDAYPAKPVKFVVPFAAGGPADLLARLTAERLTRQWGKSVIVESLPGATGSIGAHAVARAAADGYTLLFTPDIPLTMYAAATRRLPYDPQADFKPVGIIGRSSNALFVNSSLGVSSVGQLVALAKASPGKLTFSSAGVASPAHFAAELFRTSAAIEITHVPYKGAAPAMAAVLNGEASLFFGPIAQGLPHVKSGKVRALGVTGAAASPLLPGVKPLVEQRFPGLVIDVWYAVLAPANTPDPVVQTIGDALRKVIEEPGFRARLESGGVSPGWQGPQELAQAIDSDLKRWRALAQTVRIASD